MRRQTAGLVATVALLLVACSVPPPATVPGLPTGSPVAPPLAASAGPSPATERATPTASEAASEPAATAATPAPFTLTSDAFEPGGVIPKRSTCDGEDVSPALAWSGAPEATSALLLVVDDPDAAGFVHWIAYNIAPAASGGLPEGVGTGSAAPPQGTNDFGKPGWGGPCPPSGEHRYRFKLDALAAPLPLTGVPGGAQVRDALATATILGTITLEGRYARQ